MTKILVSFGPARAEDVAKQLKTPYAEAVRRSSAEPVVATAEGGTVDEIAARYAMAADGLLLTGGEDVNPARYGDDFVHETVSFSLERDEFEFALFDAFAKAGKPIFGICRGAQLVCAATGGKLVQHLLATYPDGHLHETSFIMRGDDKLTFHAVRAVPGTRLAGLIGTGDATVNSYHHQAAGEVGDGMCVSAYAHDGSIEAIEHETLPIFGVQWHPEKMLDIPEYTDTEVLFRYFVGLCAAGKTAKEKA